MPQFTEYQVIYRQGATGPNVSQYVQATSEDDAITKAQAEMFHFSISNFDYFEYWGGLETWGVVEVRAWDDKANDFGSDTAYPRWIPARTDWIAQI